MGIRIAGFLVLFAATSAQAADFVRTSMDSLRFSFKGNTTLGAARAKVNRPGETTGRSPGGGLTRARRAS